MQLVKVAAIQGPKPEPVQITGPGEFNGIEVTKGISFQRHAGAIQKAFDGFESPQIARVAGVIWTGMAKLLDEGPGVNFTWLQDPKKEWADIDHEVTFGQLGLPGGCYVEHIQCVFFWDDPETNEPMTALPISVYSAIHGSTDDPKIFTTLEACIVSGQVNSWKRNQG